MGKVEPITTVPINIASPYVLKFTLSKSPINLYFALLIGASVIILINLSLLGAFIFIHRLRKPRAPTQKELDKIEAEDEDEESEAGGKSKDVKGKKKVDGKNNVNSNASKGKNKAPAKGKEFKFDGAVQADTETLKMGSPGGENHSAVPRTDLHSVKSNK